MNSKKDRIVEKILCVGDVILDSYSKGNVNRISPEAPIPILKIESDKFVLGGSGNVARNICTAGGKCHLLSIVGKDNEAEILKKLSRECKGLTFNFVEDSSRFTTKKKRFVSGQQQILRVDQEITSPINKQIQSKILTIFKKHIDKFNVVVISDYNKGMLVEKLLKEIIKISRKKKKIVLVDPKRHSFELYKNANVITPNFQELLVSTSTPSIYENTPNLIQKLSKRLIDDYSFSAVLTTRSSKGMTIIFDNGNEFNLSSEALEVFDVSGAGDTVVAYLAVSIAKGEDLKKAAILANKAAGIAVGKFGTASVSRDEIIKNTDDEKKIFTAIEAFKEIYNNHKDLLHDGHIDYLKKAKGQCDLLVLGLNSDRSVKKLKGRQRPIIKHEERAKILSNFNFIDMIVIFDELTPIKLINKIKPALIFKGDDYQKEQVVGDKEVVSWGGKVVLIKCLKGKSTSSIIRRIKNET